jgi:hypothetical protein
VFVRIGIDLTASIVEPQAPDLEAPGAPAPAEEM